MYNNMVATPSSLIITKPKHRKDELYEREQEDILLYLLREIGINKSNFSIDRRDIESEKTKDIIRSKKEDIKKFYYVNNWNSTKTGKNLELNTLRYICRYNNIKIIGKEKKVTINGQRISLRIYFFEIPDEILNKI